MTEWLLVFTVSLAAGPGELTAGNVGGFRTDAACQAAGKSVAEAYTRLIKQARPAPLGPGNSILFECLPIRK